MSVSWPRVPLGTVLRPAARAVSVESDKVYRLLGAHWYAKGLYVKDQRSGADIRASQLFKVSPGDFVYNRLFAWKGAFALAEPEHDGCVVSNEFPCFEIDQSSMDRRWLRFYFSREEVWTQALSLSTGTTPTSRNRLKEDQFLSLQIPLPRPAEQAGIVERIQALANAIQGAIDLRAAADTEFGHLITAMAHRCDLSEQEKTRLGWRWYALGQVLKRNQDAHTVDAECRYPNLGILSFGRGVFRKPTLRGDETKYPILYRLRTGQFVYSRLFAFEGAYAYVPIAYDGHFVSQEFPAFDCMPSDLAAEFLYAHFRHPDVWAVLSAGSKGIGDRRQRVHPDTVLQYRLMLPPVEHQQTVKDAVTRYFDSERHREAQLEELRALLPSALDRAFRGQL